MSAKVLSPKSALRRFGFRQALKGALIVGLLAGGMGSLQEYAYTATYPDASSRLQFKASLASAPSLGVIYGEAKDLPTPAGYMAYRTGMFLTIIASIWGLMTATRLLRGQEEDGRWELIASGSTTAKGASAQVFIGFMLAFALAFVLSAASMTLSGLLPGVDAPSFAGLYLSLAIFVPAALFAALGFFVSQLSVTRRRALSYGLVPLLLFFVLRTIGNTVPDLHWLKMYTPFGWTELSYPTTDPQLAWLLPAVAMIPVLIAVSLRWAKKRDLGAGMLPESSAAKPHYFLLGSPLALALRQNSVQFVSWAVGAIFVSALMAQIASIAADAAADSPSLKQAIVQLGGSQNLAVAFIGAGFVFLVIVLLLMTTSAMGSIRSSEAKNQLDNLLVQPVRRSSWLISRILLVIVTTIVISLACIIATWAMAGAQGIELELGKLLAIAVALTGTVILTLGFGVLLYGIWPRLAVIGMYCVVAWSFLIDMIGSVVKLSDFFVKSSLFHYVSISPIEAPNWSTFAWLVSLGTIMTVIGVVTFAKRDIISE